MRMANKKNKNNKHNNTHKHVYRKKKLVNCELCDLVVKTEMDVHIERIYRDRKWWSLQLDKLRTFYFDSLLAELACPRHRAGGIREPNY